MAYNPFKLPFRPRWLATATERLIGLHHLSHCYEKRPKTGLSSLPQDEKEAHQVTLDFLQHTMKHLEVDFQVSPSNALDQIPTSGPLIIVCNHPLGGIEGVAMTQLLLAKRPDLKVLTNKLLTLIPELSNVFIGVNVLSANAAKENAKGIKALCSHLKQGGALLVYPAGVVSSLNVRTGRIEDRPWNRIVGMLARRYQADVLPCFLTGRNSRLFYYSGLIHKRLRTLLLPREMLKNRGETFKLLVGDSIQYSEIKPLTTREDADQAVTQYFRLASDALANQFRSIPPETTQTHQVDIAHRPSLSRAQTLIDQLHDLADYALVSQQALTAYCVPYAKLGLLMSELACERERTFRAVGEGSGNPQDSDRFDPHYQHLFVWDHQAQRMVGGYRIGRVNEIVQQHGLNGLYSRSLYQFDEQYLSNLNHSLEIGRSFVVPEYQRNPRALDTLWQGIGRYVAANPEYHTLFGCVSISREYSHLARAFLSDSLMANFRAEQSFVADIRPVKPLKVKGKTWDANVLSSLTDIAAINKLVGRFDAGKSVPVLLRHYLSLNGRFVCFGVNEQFQSSLDGLILVDLRDTPHKYLKRYLGKEGSTGFLKTWEVTNNAIA